jgi:hypothetical protein
MHVTERLRVLLAHRYTGDAVNEALLDALAAGIGDAAERIGVVAFGSPPAVETDIAVPAGRALSDPSVAPVWALAHAALYTGAVPLPGRAAGESEEDWATRARDAAIYPLGIMRGTHEAIRRTAQPLLTGGKSVFIADNFGGDYDILVRTIVAETPDPAAVERALAGSYVSGGERGAIRAELLLTYITADYPTFAEATLRFNEVADGVTAENLTREDVT